MSFSATSVSQFVDAALLKKGSFSLAYTHQNLVWHIRDHILSLLRNFSCFEPCVDAYTHDDGTTVNLLKVRGALRLSTAAPLPPIHITIWLHQSYPNVPPLVYLDSYHPLSHPYIDFSGAATTPYLVTWKHPGSNLTDLVRNLSKVFSFWPPFDDLQFMKDHGFSAAHTSLVSKREAIDRLSMRLQHDVASCVAEAAEEIRRLTIVQSTLKEERGPCLSYMVFELESERTRLRRRLKEMAEESDMLSNWLKANDTATFPDDEPEKVLEASDETSRLLIEHEAADNSIDDVIHAMDKAAERGALGLDAYLRQVRALAREQFFHRAMLIKTKWGSTRRI